jgi:penicillin-binding protein 2
MADQMAGYKGGAVAIDNQGEILALVSFPTFNPNFFVSGNTDKITEVLKNPEFPLLNRVIGGLFHPGSVFKPFVVMAALTEGVINKDYLYDDPGQIVIDKYVYNNWFFSQYGSKEGKIDVIRALARSTDTFFYKLGEFLGAEKIALWANKFALGEETGIDIGGEVAGLIPNPEWKMKYAKEAWFLGNTYHMAIGQGDLSLTPIALTRGIAAIANGGNLCVPRFSGDKKCFNLNLNSDNVEIVKKGMTEACASGGTGYTFFDFLIPNSETDKKVACKTGTAETNLDGKTHAWFTAFAPVANPDFILTVLVERGGEGSKVAGPIARKIFDYWFVNKTN